MPRKTMYVIEPTFVLCHENGMYYSDEHPGGVHDVCKAKHYDEPLTPPPGYRLELWDVTKVFTMALVCDQEWIDKYTADE